jgi:hypothetical protein
MLGSMMSEGLSRAASLVDLQFGHELEDRGTAIQRRDRVGGEVLDALRR